MGRIIRFDSNSFNLETGAIADAERRGDLTILARPHLIFLTLGSGATARGLNRLQMNRLVARVLVFEMADCLFIRDRRIQLDRGLVPLQLGPGDGRNKETDRCGNGVNRFHASILQKSEKIASPNFRRVVAAGRTVASRRRWIGRSAKCQCGSHRC
jgi:hypothetical protein